MTLKRMDNVLIITEDIEAMKAFFAEIGMTVDGETTVEGPWVDKVIGLDGAKCDIAMMRTPDGHGCVELSQFHTPKAVRLEPEDAPSNALGLRRIMFLVEGLDEVVERVCSRHDAQLVDEIAQYENQYRLCFVRGPEGVVVGLSEELG